MKNNLTKDGVIAGNVDDKYNTNNPISKFLVGRFHSMLARYIGKAGNIQSFIECGCGEGYLSRFILTKFKGVEGIAYDYSDELIEYATSRDSSGQVQYLSESIYDYVPKEKMDVVICCEVLEHLENPEMALNNLHSYEANYYVFSVPNEPIWRILNVCRGKYLANFGNTPGHINHWSKNKFVNLINSNGFEVASVDTTLPWTFILARKKTNG